MSILLFITPHITISSLQNSTVLKIIAHGTDLILFFQKYLIFLNHLDDDS
jgi:hypothetical protein